jgi:ribonuclease-3
MTTRQRKNGRPRSNEPAPPHAPLQTIFEHHFQRPELLTWALTHRSLAYETKPETLADPAADNEQLEFVGDAVLGLAVAEALFHRFPNSREGELTRLRASLVSRQHLGKVAARIDLGALLLLGRGEEQSGGRRKPALLANAIEAVIAALYLDGGLDAARAFIEKHIIQPALPDLHNALNTSNTFSGAIGDHKSALQEHLQSTGLGQPHYALTAQSGPDHQKRFRIEVRVAHDRGGFTALAEAEGATKKQAQQEAARIAFERLLAAPVPTQTEESDSAGREEVAK